MQGLLFALLAQAGWAVGLIVVNRKLAGISPFVLNFCLAAVGAISLLPLVFLFRNDLIALFEQPDSPWPWLLVLGVIWVGISDTLFVIAAQTGDSRHVALSALLFPALVAILEFALGRPFDWVLIAGFAVMAIGFAVVVTGRR